MSRRALRRLRGEQRGQEPLGPGALQFDLRDEDDAEEEGPKRELGVRRPRGAGKEGVRVNNRFELINIDDLEDDPVVNGEGSGCALTDAAAPGHKGRAQRGNTESKTDGDVAETAPPEQSNASGKLRKKKKKQKNKKSSTGEASENGLEDIDRILERMEDSAGWNRPGPAPLSSRKHVLYVEHRHLNPDTELKRYFGARAVLGEQRASLCCPGWSAGITGAGHHARLIFKILCRSGVLLSCPGQSRTPGFKKSSHLGLSKCWDYRPRQRQRVYPKCTWLTTPKSTWPRYSKPGSAPDKPLPRRLAPAAQRCLPLSRGSGDGSRPRSVRDSSFVAVRPDLSLLTIIRGGAVAVTPSSGVPVPAERALYSMECAFHPLFSLTSGACRLDYRRPENRSFYLALYKQMSFLEKRGCPRTALEYCKLILSLEPDEDPLCMLLLIDHLALRARNYEYLIRLFQEWEAHRNLSQLPNFAFSVPLAYFLLSQQTDLPEHERSSAREKASLLIQQALTMFPGVLLPLLESCSVRPDATVSSHRFFGPNAEISQPPALSQLVSLYLGRSHFLWKEPATMSWLEENVHEVLQAVDAGDPAVEACENRRKVLYQRAPRNIHRHVILSEIKDAVAALPPDVTTQSVMGFDPLPPSDTIYSYVRPERLSPISHGNTIALFFRSLLPNYTMEGERPEEGVAGGLNRNQGLNRLMLAVRDMMANFHLNDLEAPHEDDADGEGEWD
ncbi:ribosome quality control complex subunit TCF25 isoform X2 [Symphalangus syndactylus]|uniref:ribosome quality control complex subunit TCF25 isoform X2 n=1 Tax=Symphalangus syndactylus TaxID=9590 RepID=UPI0030042F57